VGASCRKCHKASRTLYNTSRGGSFHIRYRRLHPPSPMEPPQVPLDALKDCLRCCGVLGKAGTFPVLLAGWIRPKEIPPRIRKRGGPNNPSRCLVAMIRLRAGESGPRRCPGVRQVRSLSQAQLNRSGLPRESGGWAPMCKIRQI
jgi:hypothetical protein